MEFCFDATVADSVHLELKAESRAVDRHLEREVEIVKLDAARRRQPREQTARNCIEVRRQRTNVSEVARVCCWCLVGLFVFRGFRPSSACVLPRSQARLYIAEDGGGRDLKSLPRTQSSRL